MKEIIKNTVILTVITLISGVLLGFVHQVTESPIQEQQRLREEKACEAVFEEAESFDTSYEMPDDGVVSDFPADVIDKVIPALDQDGKVLGHVLTVTSGEGYGGDIQFMMGVSNDGELTGLEILSISETAGLGMKAREPEFLDQFAGKKAESLTYTKSGAAADNEIDAISGATITTKAMTNGVNAGLAYFHERLKEEGE